MISQEELNDSIRPFEESKHGSPTPLAQSHSSAVPGEREEEGGGPGDILDNRDDSFNNHPQIIFEEEKVSNKPFTDMDENNFDDIEDVAVCDGISEC